MVLALLFFGSFLREAPASPHWEDEYGKSPDNSAEYHGSESHE